MTDNIERAAMAVLRTVPGRVRLMDIVDNVQGLRKPALSTH